MVSSNTKLTKNTDINLVRLNLKISITGALMLVYQQHVNFLFIPSNQDPENTGNRGRETGVENGGEVFVVGTYAAIGSYHFCCGSDYYDPRCQDFDELSYFDDVLKVTSKSHRYDTATQ